MPTGTCVPFSKKIYLTVNGKILPCERIGHQFALGEVNSKEITIDCEGIAHMYNQIFDNLENQCSNCYRRKGCLKCIFNIEDSDAKPRCSDYQNMDSFSKYLSKNISLLEGNKGLYKKIMNEVTVE